MAVFTLLDEMHIEEVVEACNCGQLLDFWGIAAGSENTNYMCETTTGNYVLTLFEGRSKVEDILHQVDYINLLYNKGLPVPKICTQANGDVLYDLLGKKAMLQSCLLGQSVELPFPEQCYEAGKMLAAMHEAVDGVCIGVANSLDAKGLIKEAREIQREQSSEELEDVIAFLQDYEKPEVPCGVSHTDYFKNNVFFEGEKLSGVFDFWFACDELFVYDLAVSLNAWCFDKGAYNEASFKSFLSGYTSVRTLSEEEKEALPQELQRAAARFYLTRLYDSVMTDKDMRNHPPETWYKRFVFFKNLHHNGF